ncbi:DNA translocase FtsK [Youxingia wuxianensis]|uniref:DNA translocase FtsK n=1 Tax=Youxingia wuxianensis TaxID=2763678 RepID=A0A926ELG2_9FIRM|nr:DNA translocase FtsK [Youxingia wuxianensis]MBC8584555.1 DNA translocase FtsK [Youxingia wuxianensis]
MATKSSRSASSRSSSGSSRGKNAAATRKRNAAQARAKKQMRAVILFAIGIFLGALVFIEGKSFWNGLHKTLLGFFGMGAILVAAELIYIAILETMDKPVKFKAWTCSLLVCFFCGSIQIFKMGLPQSENFLDAIVEIFLMGIQLDNGGLLGAVPGLPLLHFCGDLGAKIIIILLIFVFIMLITGGTLIGLLRAAKKPVEKMGEVYADQLERRQSRTVDIPLDKSKRTPIDIPLDNAPVSRGAKTQGGAVSNNPVDIPLDKPLPQNQKFAIDIPLDDDFDPHEVGGFSLSVAQEPMQFVPAPPPSIDELVSKAATETGRFTFKADDSAGAPVPPKALKEETDGVFHFSDSDAQPAPPEPQDKGKPDTQIQAELAKEAQAAPAPAYVKPPVSLLRQVKKKSDTDITDEMKANAQRLVDTLSSFGVQTRIVDISRGPAVTRYELQPSAGVKISKITNLADDIALNLAAAGVRIEAPIPNKAAVGIEVPNKVISSVSIREIIDSKEFQTAASGVSVALGRDIAGNITIADIAKMPHLLIAGSTGSGKSVCINSIIMSLLYKSTPDEVRFLMIDPKVVELGVYNGIPQLLVPVVTDPKKAAGALSWAVTEMLKRYKLFADNSVRDITSFNHLAEHTEGLAKMPQVVIIIDELADLMMAAPNEIEDYICRLAQMARAAGMHLVIATQRPSVDVITGVIKANIPSRIAFAVSSQVDSRTILDMGGAEKLLGRGDMLFSPVGSSKPLRVQGCFVTDEEIEKVITFIKSDSSADYDESIAQEIDNHVVSGKKGSSGDGSNDGAPNEEDEMLFPAIECVIEAGQASTSLLQRRLKLGYARAARIVDEMERRGIVGPFEGSKPRQVLISMDRWLEMKLNSEE